METSTSNQPPHIAKWALLLLPPAWLWFQLINTLRLEWCTNPQYGYAMLVPFLCLGLLVRCIYDPNKPVGVAGPNLRRALVILSCLLALLFLPTRLVEAATPEWRPIQWMLALETVGLTLGAIGLSLGGGWLRRLAFPVCFFLVAVPWPTPVEEPVIQSLTRIGADIVIQVVGVLNVPAMAHGNVIEISTGMVGIDEACSGIRSFQSSLMISLFFGEYYRLNRLRRGLLIALGFGLSMAFNVFRMSLLTMIAAKQGVAAIARYHDPAGVSITIACTLGLWALAVWMKRSKLSFLGAGPVSHGSVAGLSLPSIQSLPGLARVGQVMGLCLLIWLVAVEAGIQIWYHSREAHLPPGPEWSVVFPRENPTFQEVSISPTSRNLLRYDDGEQAEWTEPDGTRWEAFYFNWRPGRVAGYLAKRHTPEACLPAMGMKMTAGPELEIMNVHGLELPVRCYTFNGSGGVLQVFQCRWEMGAGKETYIAEDLTRFNLVRGIWAGRGNRGQKVFEFIASGVQDPAQAKQALIGVLDRLIRVEK